MKGVNDPRWCGKCKRVVLGAYSSGVDGQALRCPRCMSHVRVDEDAAETMARALAEHWDDLLPDAAAPVKKEKRVFLPSIAVPESAYRKIQALIAGDRVPCYIKDDDIAEYCEAIILKWLASSFVTAG